MREGSRDGEDKFVKKSFAAKFESGLEGQLKFWKVCEGDVLDQPYGTLERKRLLEADHVPGLTWPRLRKNAHIQSSLPECVQTAEKT